MQEPDSRFEQQLLLTHRSICKVRARGGKEVFTGAWRPWDVRTAGPIQVALYKHNLGI